MNGDLNAGAGSRRLASVDALQRFDILWTIGGGEAA